jgi:hypothetical protein
LGFVLGAHGALADSKLGAQDFYFTTGLPLMTLYYIIEKDTDETHWKMTGDPNELPFI